MCGVCTGHYCNCTRRTSLESTSVRQHRDLSYTLETLVRYVSISAELTVIHVATVGSILWRAF